MQQLPDGSILVEGRFKIDGKLGEGSYGEVFKAIDLEKQKQVVMKRVKMPGSLQSCGIPPTTLREIAILIEINHKNIVKLEKVAFTSGPDFDIYLVFELMDKDLGTMIKEFGRKVPLELVKSLLYQLLEGVDYLHSNKILHRDLKPANILISQDNSQLKICDFGLSRTIHQPLRPYSNEILTRPYRSPELCVDISQLLENPEFESKISPKVKGYSIGVDTWAIGCIFAEMLLGTPLFMCSSELMQISEIIKLIGKPSDEGPEMSIEMKFLLGLKNVEKTRDLKDLIPDLDASGLHLLRSLLKIDPLQRITCKQALNHPFFNSIK